MIAITNDQKTVSFSLHRTAGLRLRCRPRHLWDRKNSKRQKVHVRHRTLLFVSSFCWSRAWLGKCISILHPSSEKCWKRVGKKTFVVVILCVSVPGSQATSSASTPSKRAFALEPNFEPGPPLPNVAGLQSKMELRQHCVTITRALRDSLRDLCTVTCS